MRTSLLIIWWFYTLREPKHSQSEGVMDNHLHENSNFLNPICFIFIMLFIHIVLEWNWKFLFRWLPWIGHSLKRASLVLTFSFTLFLSDLGAIAQVCCFSHCLLSSSNGKWALKVITHHIFFYSAGLIKNYQSFISSHLLSISPTFFTFLPWFSLCCGSQPRPASCWIKLQPRQNQRAHLSQSSFRRSLLVRWTLQMC